MFDEARTAQAATVVFSLQQNPRIRPAGPQHSYPASPAR
ncbi:hypothetical protein ACNKHU_22010 [Shigella flexneri]